MRIRYANGSGLALTKREIRQHNAELRRYSHGFMAMATILSTLALLFLAFVLP